MSQKAKIFILAFIGCVLFPHRRNSINPSIAYLVKQICTGLSYVNTVLAETFLSLNRFKQNDDKIMRAAPEILQIWFLSHLRGFGHLMQLFEIDHLTHPIQRFEVLKNNSPDKDYATWINFLKDPDPKAFLWHAKWFHEGQVRYAHQFHNPVPLLGLSGVTSYYPYRVARQYRALQEIPPPLKTDMFRVRFTRSNYKYADEIRAIQGVWAECQPENVLVPRLLKGHEKSHHASLFYILHHQIPADLQPKVPEVTNKPTRQAQIDRLERTMGTKDTLIAELVRENKRLRETEASPSSIE